MNGLKGTVVTALCIAALLVSACGQSADSTTTTSASPLPMSAHPTSDSTPTPQPLSSDPPTPSGDHASIALGSLVQVTAGGLRLRRSPSLSAEPLATLAAGQRVLVTDGPREADEHQWYEVTLRPSGQTGWVAGGNPDASWLAIVENGNLALAWGGTVTSLELSDETREPLLELDVDRETNGPAWSPNGERLAVVQLVFDDAVGCVIEGKVTAFDSTGRPVAMSSPPVGFYDAGPMWSPDGATLAFVRSGSTCGSDDDSTGLYVMREDGAERLIVDDVIAPVWSPLGDMFAFLRFDAAPTDVSGDLRGPEIWTVGADGAGLRNLGGRADTTGERERLRDQVSWAPDASLLAFSRVVGSELADVEIDVMDLDGRVRSIATVPGEVRDLRWLPDGALAYIEGRAGATAVVVFALDGREISRFELTDGVPDALVVAPDGRLLAWRIQGTSQLRVQPLDGRPHTIIEGVEAAGIAWRSVLRVPE